MESHSLDAVGSLLCGVLWFKFETLDWSVVQTELLSQKELFNRSRRVRAENFDGRAQSFTAATGVQFETCETENSVVDRNCP